MRYAVTLFYWAASVVLLAAILGSLGYSFDKSMFVGSMFLPGLLAVKFFVPQLSFANRRRGIRDAVFLSLAIVTLEWLLIVMVHTRIIDLFREDVPPILLNPVFIALMLAALALPEYLLDEYLRKRGCRSPQTVDFVSERRRVSLAFDRIAYVESNDAETRVYTPDGESFRTKTPISQWEKVLDGGMFVRIHRAYIVNRDCVVSFNRQCVVVGGNELPVSRKYGERAVKELAKRD
ncbi:MAG: LytTR family transcriptional regulator [Alistipes sp.]|nr:LytTR family transcriptional regulator [Alistipes sp.]